jgi:hypothetical protein
LHRRRFEAGGVSRFAPSPSSRIIFETLLIEPCSRMRYILRVCPFYGLGIGLGEFKELRSVNTLQRFSDGSKGRWLRYLAGIGIVDG